MKNTIKKQYHEARLSFRTYCNERGASTWVQQSDLINEWYFSQGMLYPEWCRKAVFYRVLRQDVGFYRWRSVYRRCRFVEIEMGNVMKAVGAG